MLNTPNMICDLHFCLIQFTLLFDSAPVGKEKQNMSPKFALQTLDNLI